MRIVSLILVFCTLLLPGEVDQYLVWNQLPNDETDYINRLFNKEIQAALLEINENHQDCSCEDAAGKILKHFGIGLNTTLELALKKSTDLDKYPPENMLLSERYKQSIFRRPFSNEMIEQYQDYSLNLQIDEVINVGGIYFGIDKLTHFTASGYLYYEIYQLGLEQGESDESAVQMAINMGIFGVKEYSR